VTIGGYAGTGKTTVICEFRKQLRKSMPGMPVAFATFTGKASSVLAHKLRDNKTLLDSDYIGTIHGLIYSPEVMWDAQLKTFVITGWKQKPKDEMWEKLIIIDEGSMVSKETWNDLLSYDIPILVFGDHGQLPPIGDKEFNLVGDPDFKLTKIHRQALNSPIIKLSSFIRENGYIPPGRYSKEVFKLSWNQPECKKIWNNSVTYDESNLVILCGFNTTRANLNDMIRKKLDYKYKTPYPTEKVVCLVNNHSSKIMNGQIGTVLWIMPGNDCYRITIEIDGEVYESLSSTKCFGEVTYTMYDKSKKEEMVREYAYGQGFSRVDYFDYGYAMSVHKSQGSEWDKVVLFEQRASMWDDEYYAKWLYTAITRSRQKLFVITDAWI